VSPVHWLCFTTLFLSFFVSSPLFAQAEGELQIAPPVDLTVYAGRRVDAVEVRTLGPLWNEAIQLRAVRPGDELSGELVRRALRELDRTGAYADLRAELQEQDGRLLVLFLVRPRRLIETIRWAGGALERTDDERALGLRSGDAVTDQVRSQAARALEQHYKRAGYPTAAVRITPEDTDDPRRVLLRVRIDSGEPERLQSLEFRVAPSPHHPSLSRALGSYALRPGVRLDAEAIVAANEALIERLVSAKFYQAEVSHEVHPGGALVVLVNSGPKFLIRIEGNQTFGDQELEDVLRLEDDRDPRPEILNRLLTEFYVEYGFYDVRVSSRRLDGEGGLSSEIAFYVQEGNRFRIARRLYPCLTGGRSPKELDHEIEGVLSEEFPPVGILAPASAGAVNGATATKSPTPRPSPFRAEPWNNFSSESHEAVVEHLEDLYRSEGYLDARVGPATLSRRVCRLDSPPGQCFTHGPVQSPELDCKRPPPKTDYRIVSTCQADTEKGERCEAEGTLILPIYAGRQAVLYDVAVEGNAAFSSKKILDVAALKVGAPLRRLELEGALRRIQLLYEEEAYAFAQIDSEIELSVDHTRARLVIGITERKQVRVGRVDIRGALLTREGLVRSRLSLKAGDLYRRSLIQRSQEQLESLSVFTSVTIALEDPGVPAQEKVVVITVAERLPQYLDIKGGFGSADGVRVAFEYGHRNLGGEAIQLTLRSQLALRPPFLISEPDVRENYSQLDVLDMLERRNTATLAFPEIGLGPLFRFEVEFLDLGQNQRDFIQRRDAGVVRLLFRPRRPYLVTLGGTIELNDVYIIGGSGLDEVAPDVRVPEGRSVAYTQNLGASWDARDKPLSATRGFLASLGTEHVTAVPLGESQRRCDEAPTENTGSVCSELLRFFGRLAGYIPMGRTKMTLALSMKAGVIQQLNEFSQTYPDRLFFMGGVDTLRGFPQDSLVPQDVAEQVLDPNNNFTINDVALRGGDIFVNPRAELRIPVLGSIQTAPFIDAGNLWYDRSQFQPFNWRYTVGTGVRIETPVGPLVFDYGFNVARVVDAFTGGGPNSRYWEDIGAFHFSIGLF